LMFSGSKHCPCCGEKAVHPQIIAEEKVKASPSANLLVFCSIKTIRND